MMRPKTRKKYTTKNIEETFLVAQKIAKGLHGGEVIGLKGDLGSGKTTFTKGLAEALKVEEPVTSPTFVILKIYPAKIRDKKVELVHIDAYRLENADDARSVGLEDYFGRDDVVMIIEWPERIKDILPSNYRELNFKFIDENTREIEYDTSN